MSSRPLRCTTWFVYFSGSAQPYSTNFGPRYTTASAFDDWTYRHLRYLSRICSCVPTCVRMRSAKGSESLARSLPKSTDSGGTLMTSQASIFTEFDVRSGDWRKSWATLPCKRRDICCLIEESSAEISIGLLGPFEDCRSLMASGFYLRASSRLCQVISEYQAFARMRAMKKNILMSPKQRNPNGQGQRFLSHD